MLKNTIQNGKVERFDLENATEQRLKQSKQPPSIPWLSMGLVTYS